ncbi:MAG: hypothetical protein Q8R12_01475, partial [bacterium]|nr:hypothetical protein [bacterium]
MEKHPVRTSMPDPKVEVADGEMLIVLAPVFPKASRVPGLVVPMPKLPVSNILAASVKSPDLKLEKIKSDFPVREFWVRREVKAPVV